MSEALEEKVLVVGAERPGRSDTVRIERVDRRVRNRFGGQVIADSRRVLLVWEPRRLPVYWFPLEDVRTDYLKQTTRTAEGGKGDGTKRGGHSTARRSTPHRRPARKAPRSTARQRRAG